MVTALKTCLRLESDPRIKRVGSSVLWVAIIVGYFFMAMWLIVACWAFFHNAYWGIVIGGSAIAFATFLTVMARSLWRDARRHYVLELTDTDAVLNIVDYSSKRRSTQMVLLDDIRYAEYYPYRDSAAVILHTSYAQMEVPLWPLGRHAQDVLDYLEGRGVRVINVQSDEPIPD